jgi:hypothetical protein
MSNPGPTERATWQPIETAPRDQTPIKVMLPDGSMKVAMWVWGGGWAGEWDRRRPNGFGGWLAFNDTHQPTHWMPLLPPIRRNPRPHRAKPPR